MNKNYTSKRDIETNGLYSKNFGSAPYGFERHHIIPYKTCIENGDIELACNSKTNSVDLPKDLHNALHRYLGNKGYSKQKVLSVFEYDIIRELTDGFLKKYNELLDDYYDPNISMEYVIGKYDIKGNKKEYFEHELIETYYDYFEEVINYYYYQNLTRDEIAKITGLTKQDIRKIITYEDIFVKHQLKDKFKTYKNVKEEINESIKTGKMTNIIKVEAFKTLYNECTYRNENEVDEMIEQKNVSSVYENFDDVYCQSGYDIKCSDCGFCKNYMGQEHVGMKPDGYGSVEIIEYLLDEKDEIIDDEYKYDLYMPYLSSNEEEIINNASTDNAISNPRTHVKEIVYKFLKLKMNSYQIAADYGCSHDIIKDILMSRGILHNVYTKSKRKGKSYAQRKKEELKNNPKINALGKKDGSKDKRKSYAERKKEELKDKRRYDARKDAAKIMKTGSIFENIDKVVRYYESGVSISDIAYIYNTTTSIIRRILKYEGVYRKPNIYIV